MVVSEQKVEGPPGDSVSKIDVSSTNKVLSSSWDGELRVWQILSLEGNSNPLVMTKYNTPILSAAFFTDGSKAFAGTADGSVKLWDLASNQSTDIGKHDAAVKDTCWVAPLNVLATSSWDGSIRWWDMRSPNPVANIKLSDRCYAMAIRDNLMTVYTADRNFALFDLSNPTIPMAQKKSKLQLHVRCIDIALDKSCYFFGSAEGRSGINYLPPQDPEKDFSFKSHRDDRYGGYIYPVHSIAVHPRFGTFSTSGGDGESSGWDHIAKSKISRLHLKKNMPVTASKFSPDGNFFVIGTGYDWAKGKAEYERICNDPLKKPQIYIIKVKDSDLEPRKKKGF